jgi:hypothetical protein
MRSLLKLVLDATVVVLALTWGRAPAADAKPRVTMELLTERGLPLTASRQWYEALTELGIGGLQIRSAGPRDEAGITKQGTKAAPEYRVVGILSAANVLVLPGGKFKLNDTARLRKWLDDLQDQGAEGVTQPRSAFGLVASQLEEVAADLKRPVTFSTKGLSAAAAIERLGGQLRYPLVLDEAAGRALKPVELADELRGLSAGTAAAIMLRPAGLVLVPERPAGGQLQYRVSGAGGQSWPIGWKPERPSEALGVLFEFLNVEIADIPVSEALAAIEGRLKVPLVYDRNAMALHGIDPSSVQADVPSKRLSYSQTLRRVLAQAKLKYELRVDEAEKPFLWITTIKPVE